ncbi:hypothetical protein V6N11_058744 [Hibiscus sabdariffa]|uniref:Uncharacterized protein n=1 Tax=Hibiscus sabdariffa TaxID=183260 RepID=A0ABR2U552_9ROSI
MKTSTSFRIFRLSSTKPPPPISPFLHRSFNTKSKSSVTFISQDSQIPNKEILITRIYNKGSITKNKDNES